MGGIVANTPAANRARVALGIVEGTNSKGIEAQRQKERIFCSHGHRYDGLKYRENGTYIRYCKTCDRERAQRYRDKKRKEREGQ